VFCSNPLVNGQGWRWIVIGISPISRFLLYLKPEQYVMYRGLHRRRPSGSYTISAGEHLCNVNAYWKNSRGVSNHATEADSPLPGMGLGLTSDDGDE